MTPKWIDQELSQCYLADDHDCRGWPLVKMGGALPEVYELPGFIQNCCGSKFEPYFMTHMIIIQFASMSDDDADQMVDGHFPTMMELCIITYVDLFFSNENNMDRQKTYWNGSPRSNAHSFFWYCAKGSKRWLLL